MLIDVAKDALQAQTTFSWPQEIKLPGYRPVARPHAKQVREAARLIVNARGRCSTSAAACSRPAHGGAAHLAELTGIPVVTTLMARGAFPDSHPHHLGMPGMHGTVAAVTALQKADLIISLGARFDDRGDRQALDLRPGRGGRPRRHRPGRDLQEPRRRRADRG